MALDLSIRPKTLDSTSIKDALWYKDAVIYEIHVRAFYDSNGDGIGDFQGLTQKLSYIKELGATAIWLLPFYPSPLKDDGYDIASYTSINPIYGSLTDFKNFLDRAHELNLKVITELVINHTSDQHPWFQRARHSPAGSPERDFYVWNDSPNKYKDTRIIFTDFEPSNWTWDPVARAYYWHRFYHHQPDLNFDNPRVHEAIFSVLDFWLNMGVDGMRLDAVPYLYEREGTNCENLPETHQFLKKLRAHVDEKFSNKMLLAEANQWPEDAIEYFGNGDECHMSFHFPLMPRLFMSIKMEDRYPIIDILEQTPEPPDNAAWAIFLRNHDELTLEMVTDEERDYMYRLYASDQRARINLGIRRRLTPLLNNDRRAVELMNGLLFSMKGTPVIYYGDEIGMGDNIYLGDRDGVRTPFQWSSDRNAGFSSANPQQLYLPVNIDHQYHYVSINVESQVANPTSLLWWMKSLISIRKDSIALRRGDIRMLHPENRKVLCYLRCHSEETVLVVANLSVYPQSVELDLSEFRGHILNELFGHTDFPAIGESPYLLMLGGYSFYWFSLKRPQGLPDRDDDASISSLFINNTWEAIFKERYQDSFMHKMKNSLLNKRWFAGKARKIRYLNLKDAIPFNYPQGRAFILMVEVNYYSGEPELYVLPISYVSGAVAQKYLSEYSESIWIKLCQENGDFTGLIIDATTQNEFNHALLESLLTEKCLNGNNGQVCFKLHGEGRKLIQNYLNQLKAEDDAQVLKGEQSNTSVQFKRDFILKLFRKTDAGINPDLEITSYLSTLNLELPIPQIYGSFHYEKKDTYSLGFIQGYVANEGNAWQLFTDNLKLFYASALARLKTEEHHLDNIVDDEGAVLANYVQLLAIRTAEIHDALAIETSDMAFAPLPFTEHYQRGLYQTLNMELDQTIELLKKQSKNLDSFSLSSAKNLIQNEDRLLNAIKLILFKGKGLGRRTRVHGDYHLGQVIFTGKDFVIIDFEGEPSRPLSERRIKRSPLRDVAGMLRSLHYAAHFALSQSGFSAEDIDQLRDVMDKWINNASEVFLDVYYSHITNQIIIPADLDARSRLLEFFMIEKVLYEVRYELGNRPQWIEVPLSWINQLLDQLKEEKRETA